MGVTHISYGLYETENIKETYMAVYY